MLAQGQVNTAQFCSATTQAAYSLLTLHSYVFRRIYNLISKARSMSFSAPRQIKPLGKLRHKPQVFEVFHCSSIGIDAKGITPDLHARSDFSELPHFL
jgi:hypothetical protein